MAKKKCLNPCPFCGGPAELIEIETGKYKTVYMPRCQDPFCCARVTRKWTEEDTAIYAWNRRVPHVKET